jgi:hypothetical protein
METGLRRITRYDFQDGIEILAHLVDEDARIAAICP